jgi:DNA-binding transcriptional MerR regulator
MLFRAMIVAVLAFGGSVPAQTRTAATQQADPAPLQLSLEVGRLQAQLETKRSIMLSAAGQSPHRTLDPVYKNLANEVAQLEAALTQRRQQLDQQIADMQQADLRAALAAMSRQLAELNGRLAKLEQDGRVPPAPAGNWPTIRIKGIQYYLVPVNERTREETAPSGRPPNKEPRPKVTTIEPRVPK